MGQNQSEMSKMCGSNVKILLTLISAGLTFKTILLVHKTTYNPNHATKPSQDRHTFKLSTEEKMEERINSDMNPEMLASTTFYEILDQIKSSNLNFQLSLSPFSAQISLRKSLVKDRSGRFLLPSSVLQTIGHMKAAPNPTAACSQNDEVTKLNSEIKELKKNAKNATEIINMLEQKLGQAEAQALKAFEQKKTDIDSLKNSLKNSDCESKNLRKDLENSRKIVNEKEKLIQQLGNKCDQLTSRNKDLKAELNITKKENKKLSQQKSENHNDLNQNVQQASLPTKATSSSSSSPSPPRGGAPPSPLKSISPPVTPSRRTLPGASTLSGAPPSPHTPPGLPPSSSTWSAEQAQPTTACPSNILESLPDSNPSTEIKDEKQRTSPTTQAKFSRNFLRLPPTKMCPDVCTHSPQCIIREPLPPPFPSITFLYNEESQYHTHMMQWSKEEFAGCGRCFSIENENYGCKDCRWLKFWYGRHGQTHGFPDLANWIYRKYL